MAHLYTFIVYSCKKNLQKSEALYKSLENKLAQTKVYIMYGDENIDADYKITDEKYLVLKVNDTYDFLMDKTLALLKTINLLFPESKGMFKCDDDVVVNIKHINTFIQLLSISPIDYAGHCVVRTKEYNTWSRKNNYDKYPVEECSYCGGPLYFLSKKSLDCFQSDRSLIKKIYYEDMLVGYHLNKHNIFPDAKYNLYSDYISASPKISYHNQKHFEELYVVIQGGLANQLFQIACGMQMADKYNKIFVLNTRMIIPNPHQQNNLNITLTTLQKIFPHLPIVNTPVQEKDYFVFHEGKNDCFFYTEKIDQCLQTYNNVILKGYFIHNKYIPESFYKIEIQPDDKKLLTVDFTNVYFLHIRLGDYLKVEMYNINLTKYYNYCIERILSLNPNAVFYICTNQYDMILRNIVNKFPPMRYIIQDKTNNGLDTLYIMASCCGAICSNSTLSFMGALFQKNKKKEHIYMPYPFVKFIDGFNAENLPLDMYPDWCTVYRGTPPTTPS
jgi:hypothetical protein